MANPYIFAADKNDKEELPIFWSSRTSGPDQPRCRAPDAHPRLSSPILTKTFGDGALALPAWGWCGLWFLNWLCIEGRTMQYNRGRSSKKEPFACLGVDEMVPFAVL